MGIPGLHFTYIWGLSPLRKSLTFVMSKSSKDVSDFIL